jgi:transcriptional regulator with XRE-family HTH domain
VLLSDWMDKVGMSDGEMAAKVGCSRSAISRYRSGERMPRPETLIKLVDATNHDVSPMDFVKGLKRG